MSLLSEAMENCTMMDKTTAPDGYGGFTPTWTTGAPFKAAFSFDQSTEARVAEAQGVTSRYTVTTSRAVNLQYRDVFIRERDGKIFRVASDGDDMFTPQSAGLDMRQVEAEEWQIPASERASTNG